MSTIVTHVQATASSGDRDERIGLEDVLRAARQLAR